MSVPKVQLDLDGVFDGQDDDDTAITRSMVDVSIAPGVEDEKCVVAQYRTAPEQKETFIRLVSSFSRSRIPIEWVIDIADESNGWFYATAYHYDDIKQQLHVMVPDKENPTFDGEVPLDHRTLHLIECVDGRSEALFNKIVRDSVIKVKWELEWFEESELGEGNGTWVSSVARYYIRIANQLLVEDKEVGENSKGFVIITADNNVKLNRCLKGKGLSDFNRLIQEGSVLASTEALNDAGEMKPREKRTANAEHGSPEHEGGNSAVKRLAEISSGLKECLEDIVEDRKMKVKNDNDAAVAFKEFLLGGDLDKGLLLMNHFEQIEKSSGKNGLRTEGDENDNGNDIEAIVNDALYLAGKLERTVTKISAKGTELSIGSPAGSTDVDTLKKAVKKLKKELDEKDRELKQYSRGTKL